MLHHGGKLMIYDHQAMINHHRSVWLAILRLSMSLWIRLEEVNGNVWFILLRFDVNDFS